MRSRIALTLRSSGNSPAITATESAPADQTAAAFSSVIPPIATRGFSNKPRQRAERHVVDRLAGCRNQLGGAVTGKADDGFRAEQLACIARG